MFGKDGWQRLDRILRQHWADYLMWFRRVVGVPVRNGCEVLEIAPAAHGLLAATVQAALKSFTRGKSCWPRASMGKWTIPAPLDGLPVSLCANAADAIDFDALRGEQVVVIGAGASAFDNAATALEAGAAEVHLLCRRTEVQLIQPYLWSLADLSRLPAPSERSRRCLALALHAHDPRPARGISAADL
jgi:hypothetical protein